MMQTSAYGSKMRLSSTMGSVKHSPKQINNPLEQEHPSEFYQSQVVEINWKNPSHEDEKDPESEKLGKMRVDVEKRILQRKFE